MTGKEFSEVATKLIEESEQDTEAFLRKARQAPTATVSDLRTQILFANDGEEVYLRLFDCDGEEKVAKIGHKVEHIDGVLYLTGWCMPESDLL